MLLFTPIAIARRANVEATLKRVGFYIDTTGFIDAYKSGTFKRSVQKKEMGLAMIPTNCHTQVYKIIIVFYESYVIVLVLASLYS